ncbi:hypothetical protein EYF80_032336 [Liparis tanakae]|uniref:Uncharacterized protein n=1 Tax=Liparis tanakae TaxID=230148 RepID=A0A4Z2GV51_9TELE|nr:hypothetical protein EYF80_032336 [Liparis tanakae]
MLHFLASSSLASSLGYGLLSSSRDTDLASRKRERRIMTASQVLCFSCIWMELNLRWMMLTMRSISLGEMGRVRDCSLSRFITWVVNSLHAWMHRQDRIHKEKNHHGFTQNKKQQKKGVGIGVWSGCSFTGRPWRERF